MLSNSLSCGLGLQQAGVLPAERNEDADVVVEGSEVDGHPASLLGEHVISFEAQQTDGRFQGASLGGQVQGCWT